MQLCMLNKGVEKKILAFERKCYRKLMRIGRKSAAKKKSTAWSGALVHT